MSGLNELLTSKKSLMVLLVVLAMFVSLWLGKVQYAEVESLLKLILPTWLGAQAIVDSAEHFSNARQGAALIQAQVQAANAIAPPATATTTQDAASETKS